MKSLRTNVIEELKQLKKDEKIADWSVLASKVMRANQYVTKANKTESFLESDRKGVEVVVYLRKKGKLYDSSIFLDTNNSLDIRRRLKEAITLAKYSEKQDYALSGPGKISTVKLADPVIVDGFIQETIDARIEEVIKKVFDTIKKNKGVKLNGMELFVTWARQEVYNSKGVSLKQERTSAYIEVVLAVKDRKREMEFFPAKKVCRFEDLDVKKFVEDNVLLVKDVLRSKGSIHHKGRVMLSGDALTEFFTPELSAGPLVTHCSARMKYMGLSKYSKGKEITEARKDVLTIYSDPTVSYNLGSSGFDSEGTVPKKTLLIQHGKFRNYIASKRYADYLGVKVTGGLGVIVIEPGSIASALMRKGTVVEIVSFSSFTPNSISGDFSAEIRLGYLWNNGKKTPFKGGMFTGNVFKLAEDMRLSKKLKEVSGYKGPEAVVFYDGVVAGI